MVTKKPRFSEEELEVMRKDGNAYWEQIQKDIKIARESVKK